jgi:hypothetical protein
LAIIIWINTHTVEAVLLPSYNGPISRPFWHARIPRLSDRGTRQSVRGPRRMMCWVEEQSIAAELWLWWSGYVSHLYKPRFGYTRDTRKKWGGKRQGSYFLTKAKILGWPELELKIPKMQKKRSFNCIHDPFIHENPNEPAFSTRKNCSTPAGHFRRSWNRPVTRYYSLCRLGRVIFLYIS